ncbi:hypothetical protein HMPREF9086_2843 [Enterobacter hormaechei ATCC 49162]|nr:hypothetical protein HMPREF9086_2843 [Enterobacter hormaechei ATCC 49162]
MLTLTRVKAKQHPDIQTVAAIVRFFNAHLTRTSKKVFQL